MSFICLGDNVEEIIMISLIYFAFLFLQIHFIPNIKEVKRKFISIFYYLIQQSFTLSHVIGEEKWTQKKLWRIRKVVSSLGKFIFPDLIFLDSSVKWIFIFFF